MSYNDILNDGEVLSRLTHFVVERDDGRIVIEILDVMNAHGQHFLATPYLGFNGPRKAEFFGAGNSADEALRDCLRKIKSKSFAEIMAPKSGGSYDFPMPPRPT